MKFLCDVHIFYKLVSKLNSLGFKTIHVNKILEGERTKDSDICKYADDNDLVVVTKDADFINSHFIKQSPKKLIKINLGNLSNDELIKIFIDNIINFQKLNQSSVFLIELDKDITNLIEI